MLVARLPRVVALVVGVAALLSLLAAPARAVTIDLLPVGNAGNANDPATGGIYGGVNELAWAIADGVVGASTTPGYRWAWQTKAWSGGKRAPGAVLFQREVVTATDPGALIDGVSVDVDDVLAPDFGQWDLPR